MHGFAVAHKLPQEILVDAKLGMPLAPGLSSVGWMMQFDDYPGRIIKLEIDVDRNRVILTATLETEEVG